MTKKLAPVMNHPDSFIATDEDLKVLAAIDAHAIAVDDDHPATDMNDTPAPEEVVEAAPVRALSEILNEIGADDRTAMVVKINTAFDERAAHETAVNPANGNIHATLKKCRAKMALPGIAGLMIATSVSPEVINRSISEGSRFNVYAIDKLNDLLHGLNSGHFKNAINQAVMKSLFKFRAAGVPFTGIAAAAAASDKVVVDKAIKGLLVRHTVSAATAPTQSSSTMTALQALGVVANKGTAKHPIWELTSTSVTEELFRRFA